MARFFVWSDAGDSVFLARRLASEGHAVDVYIHDPASRRLGDGLVRKAAAPAVGDDVGELRRRCLALAAGLALPGLQYRNDPVARVERVWAALQDFGCGREGGEADGRALAMGD
jgi:hypothetical protein